MEAPMGPSMGELPVAMGTFVSAPPQAPPQAASAGRAMPALVEAAEVFKAQLGIKGTSIVEVVDAACDALGIPVAGLTLMEKATRCWEQL